MNEVVFLGGGGHAKVVYDIISSSLEFVKCSFFDDNERTPMGSDTDCPKKGPLCEVLSGEAKIPASAFFLCPIGDNALRRKIVMTVQAKYPKNRWYTVVDSSANVSNSAKIGPGSMVLAGAVIQTDARIGSHSIINSAAIIEHDSCLGDYVHVAPNATLCGRVHLEEATFVGAAAKIIPRVRIGAFAVIGAGVVVLDDVPDSVTVTETWKRHKYPVTAPVTSLSPSWLPRKLFVASEIQTILEASILRNHFANNGPTVQRLESYVGKLLGIECGKAVIAVSNATVGLHAVVDAWGGGSFVTQAFTFPASAQGPLQKAQIVDISEATGGLDVTQIVGKPAGIIVTNVFGHLANLDVYTEYARKTGCKLLFDNAATPWSFWEDNSNACNLGNAAVISFHHTKPLGFGEGGIIIIDKEDEPMIRRIINFGYDVGKGNEIYMPTGSNYKMSDVSAAFILAHLQNRAKRNRFEHQWRYVAFQTSLKNSLPEVQLVPHFGKSTPFVSCLAVLFPHPVSLKPFQAANLYVRKYYKPLSLDRDKFPVAWNWYDRIICFPCHEEVTDRDLNRYLEACKTALIK